MEEFEEQSIDDIIKEIRAAIIEKERKKYFGSFAPEATEYTRTDGVFELSKTMLVARENIPYQLGVWSFDDVAKKMLKKYKNYFKSLKNDAEETQEMRVA
ncbi:MAG: hypothetical protein J6Y91_05345 [Alphaproteobacteria bacterium]|nr:hypothetical protein [Alphaproteobacteria bacterium]